ncbi:hypothetical protein CYFUS_001878 [Cystobacter fuscus]|uniref:Type IV secretion protein Rhs n=1 Tax=Cystobacter fuscus TaxID=43 RepID=A0A250IYT7_9BACT|nr:DUF6531 domain-containing protein [Cystobacter fuscus]ATB36463.1 hypothetical protein CYFUS_001878 [Cystobacter fuscus]
MMPAVKHLDPVLGIDIHFIITPPGAVVPIPHPHIGIVFDPFDYIPIIGSTVLVNGLPRAQAGTGGVTLPPHFPIGGVFAKPPGNENETFMGSSTVMVDDEPFTYMTLPVLSCQDIGMPSPPRKKGPGAKTLLLPTSIALSIPAGPPVIVGGPPTISLSGLMMKLALGALLKGLKKLRNLQKASRKMSDVSDRIHKAANKVMDKVGLGERARDRIHKAICTLTGHPVDVVTGRAVTKAVDWELPGPIPLKFERNYSSSLCERDSAVGHGWSHSLDLAVWEEQGKVVYRAEDGREIAFDMSQFPRQRAPLGQAVYEPMDRLTLRRMGELQWSVELANGLVHELRFVGGEDPGLCRVTRTRNRAGHAIHYEYDSRGRLEWVVDSARRRLRFEHDAKGRLVRTWLPHPTQPGLVPYNRYVYSEAGDLVEAHDALAHAARYQYSGHLLVRETDRTGLSFHFEYDGQGAEAWCVHTWGDGGIHDHRLFYDKERGVTEVTNSLGHTTTYYSDGRGVVVKEVDPLSNVWQREYDDALRLVKEVDPLGRVQRYTYDARGNCVGFEGADGAKVSIQYDEQGNPSVIVDPRGNTWRWNHDSYGQMLWSEDPLGERTRFVYERGLLRQIVYPNSARLALDYDNSYSISRLQLANGAEAHYTHDRLGRVIKVAEPEGGAHHLRYDAEGRVVESREPDGNVSRFQYDAEGNLVALQDNDSEARFGYQGFHRLAWRQDAGSTIRLKYDTEGHLLEVRDQAGHATRFVLDPRGFPVEEYVANEHPFCYGYDGAGQLVRIQRPSGSTTECTYDEAGRLVHRLYSGGGEERLAYQLDGSLVEAVGEGGTVRFEYDAAGRLLRESQGDHWVAVQYDASGERSRLASSLGLQATFVRDAMGDLRSLGVEAEANTSRLDFLRNPLGRELERRLPGGVAISWRYDSAGRPEMRQVHNGPGRIHATLFHWRSRDRLLSLTDDLRGTTRFQHDPLGQLTAAHLPDGTWQFRHVDVSGNLFRQMDRSDRRYGPGNILEEADGTRYLHDVDGNLVAKVRPDGSRWSYRYNGSGLLKEVVTPTGELVSFTYDALGRRVRKRVGARETRWLWDGQVVLHELEDEQEPVTWVFDTESFAPLVKVQGGQHYCVSSDHLGTPIGLYDVAGQLAWSMQLDVFGVGMPDTSRTDCPWRWPGQYADSETGLYYNRFRYYDPELGRYTTPDPLGLVGGLNAYAYTIDPLAFLDPLGEMPWSWNPNGMGHHLVPRGKANSLGLQHLGTKFNTPTFFPTPYHSGMHEELHRAVKPQLGKIQGPWKGTDKQLFSALRKGLKGMTMRGDLRIPATGEVLARNVTPLQAFNRLMKWNREQVGKKAPKCT